MLADQISKANIPLQRTRTANIAEPDQSKRTDIKPPIRIKTSHLNPGQLLSIRDIRTEIDSAWSLRSQVKIVVDALRLTPRGAVATWDEIDEMFFMTRGAVADLYKKGVPYITSAFRGAGIVLDYDEKTGLNYCRVDRNEAVKVRHWVNVQSAEANAKRVKLDKLKLLVDVLNT